jgi:hypothetical protein
MTTMHPELTYRIALLRIEEDARRRRTPRLARATRRGGRRRRHGTTAVPSPPRVELVPLRPPRPGHEPTDRRAA